MRWAALAVTLAACAAPALAPVAPAPRDASCADVDCGARTDRVAVAAPVTALPPTPPAEDDDELAEPPADVACLSNRGGCAGAAPPGPADPAPVAAVGFAVGRAALDPAARRSLDEAAARLQARPELALVEVAGQVEARERDGGLATARARAVAAYLVARGVAAERLVVTRAPSAGRQVALTVRLAVEP